MSLAVTLIALVAALMIDAVVSYPDVVYRKIGHPVTWIGALVDFVDRRLNNREFSAATRRVAGVVAVVFIIGMPVAAAWIITALLPGGAIGIVITAMIAATLIAARSLDDHVADVAMALDTGGVDAGRTAVSKIVGRDPQSLDEHGVARAAIESLAENAADGVVAPVFWFVVFGLPGIVAYKAINTADSMIGHKSEKYQAFGWAAARTDDLANLPASRLTAIFITAAAALLSSVDAKSVWAVVRRDAAKHRSPNAGWPEAAMAGALDLQLAGPRQYGGTLVDDATMGDGRRDATSADIRRALRVARTAWWIMFTLVAATAIGVSIIA